MAFKDNLAALPEVQGSRLRLFDEQGRDAAVIENRPVRQARFAFTPVWPDP